MFEGAEEYNIKKGSGTRIVEDTMSELVFNKAARRLSFLEPQMKKARAAKTM